MARRKNRRKKSSSPLTRRQLLGLSLGTLGIGTTGWAVWRFRENIPPQISETFAKLPRIEFPKPSSPPPAPTSASSHPVILPHEKDYAKYLDTLDLRYISSHEILSPHRRERNGVINVLPPREFWTRMVPTLEIADELRHRLGVKLRYITSAYRSPDYNAQCPGASPRSYHTKNLALDLVYDCSPKVAMAEAKKMRNEGLFRGGLGLYRTFIHIDTRGRNATWG